ncbi:sulfinoalanine decarboxylase [Mytilus galloprovincialis]|uniref:Sulfinoalanine decarboxylase n=2 Tax=Mytilus galloprovincialis TaxID=29158 RepID=A0A8B6F923_MYTGA|nr:sulfinoalanine decarboxylase [Mytilus galloprovincialis]
MNKLIPNLTRQLYSKHSSCLFRYRNMASQTPSKSIAQDYSYAEPEIQQFVKDFSKLIQDEALTPQTDPNTKVINFRQPLDLQKYLDVEIDEEPVSREKLLELGRRVIDGSVVSGHPRFFNQLYSGIDPYSLFGAWLAEVLNCNVHTYEVAPVMVVLENYIFKKLSSIIGYQDGEGVFCPGGSFCNIMAIHLAKLKYDPTLKQKGVFSIQPMVLLTSEDAHYSIAKGANFLGFGTDSIIKVKTDDKGRVKPDDLENKIQQCKQNKTTPVMFMATCGTTVLGAYDDLEGVADVCQRHNVWMHVDAAWGGGVMLSDKLKHLTKGVERSDSVAWNIHKMSGAGIQCSALVVKEKGFLEKCNAYRAEYLFQPDKLYDTEYDIGDRTVQCGRKNDVLKVWLMWKGRGDKAMAARVEKAFENAKYLTEKVRSTEGFRLVLPEYQCTNISFWYIPPRLRGKEETPEWWQEVAKIAPNIKARMMLKGSMMIGYQPMSTKGLVNFFRVIVGNPICEKSDMDFIVEEIMRLGDTV